VSYLDWHVGMKVVCIDDDYGHIDPDDDAFREIRPVKVKDYTIRDIGIGSTGLATIRVEEIINAPMVYSDGYAEVSFYAFRFRPVQTRKTDISIFTSMLNGAKERERA
jgi:hypothetical protein